MAPNFLSKFVKTSASPQAHGRDRSNESNLSPSPARSRVSSFANSNSVTDPHNGGNSSLRSANTDDAASSNIEPSVNVVPPSPHSDSVDIKQTNTTSEGQGSDSNRYVADGTNTGAGLDRRAISSPLPFQAADSVPSPTQRPSPLLNSATSANGTLANPSPSLTPASSTGDLRQFVQRLDGPSPPIPVLELPPPDLRRQGSNKSLNQPSPIITSSHSRVATSTQPQTDSEKGNDHSNGITMTPIVESPTGVHHPPSAIPRDVTSSQSELSARTLTTPPKEPDAVSVNSKAKKRTWRRGASPSRKPTGLASAIAASGLAMANPALSSTQHAQLSPKPLQSSGTHRKPSLPSPPYMSPSRSASSVQHTRVGSRDSVSINQSPPNSSKSPKRSRHTASPRSRRPSTSVSVMSEPGTNTYEEDPGHYSGLEESSGEDSDESEDDLMDLDLGEDDIPVTGFAVASNKRNADFHELFPTIPEGDYLIEGSFD